MNLFRAQISPLADDLSLVYEDGLLRDKSCGTPMKNGEENVKSNHIAGLRRSLARRLFAGTLGKPESGPRVKQVMDVTSVGSGDSEQAPPTSAFLTMATITIQLSMLRELSRSETTAGLASATCEGLLVMLQPMPPRALKNLSNWESSVLDQISGVMKDLLMSSETLRDSVKSLLLSFAIHRASLRSILDVLKAIIQQPVFQLSPPAAQIVKKLRLISMEARLRCMWSSAERTFPIRDGDVHAETEDDQYSAIAASSDCVTLYISSKGYLRKVGSGDSRVCGLVPVVEGHVGAVSLQGGKALTFGSRLYTAVRRKGSVTVELFERDSSTLEVLKDRPKLTLPFSDRDLVEAESMVTLSTLGDDKGGRTLSWLGPNAWISGSNVQTYFEVLVNDDIGTLSIGWYAPGFNAADNLRLGGAGDNFCWGVDVIAGEKFLDGTRTSWGSQFNKGDVLGCALEIDAFGKVSMSFSKNGSWDSPLGKAFTLNAVPGASSLKFRPFVSYSCDDVEAPQMNIGSPVNEVNMLHLKRGFRFAPPRDGFSSVRDALVLSSTELASFPLMEDLGHLPPLATDGADVLICVSVEGTSGGRRSSVVSSAGNLIVETYKFDETVGGIPVLIPCSRRTLRQPGASVNRSPLPWKSLRVATNGFDVFLGTRKEKECVSIFVSGDEQEREFKETHWTGMEPNDIPDAICFDRRLNVVWAWDSRRNAIIAFENEGVADGIVPEPVRTLNDAPQPGRSIDACEQVLFALARLAKPFLIEVPLNQRRSRCVVCDHPDVVKSSYRDLFLEPCDSETLSSLAKLLETSLDAQNDSAVESLLSLLLVNLHVSFCTRSGAAGDFKGSPETIASLKSSLFTIAHAFGNEPLRRLAQRVFCEAIPIFWPSYEDKITLVRQCFVELLDEVVCQQVLLTLNDHLVELDSFPMHRALLDDTFIQGLLLLDRSDYSGVSEAAAAVIVGLIASAGHHLKIIAEAEVTQSAAASVQAVKRFTHDSGSADGGMMDEEESKEEESSSVQTGEKLGAKTPAQMFDDVVNLIFMLLDKCADNGFQTSLSRKVLPVALTVLDQLLSEPATRSKTTRAVLKVDGQGTLARTSSIVLRAVKALDRFNNQTVQYSFVRKEHLTQTIDKNDFSRSGSSDSVSVLEERRLSLHFPFANKITIMFEPHSQLIAPREAIRFYRANSAEILGGNERGYSGKHFPGVDAHPPLTVYSDRVDAVLIIQTQPTQQQGSPTDVESKIAFTVVAQRIVTRTVRERPWFFHVVDAFKSLLTSLLQATVGSYAFNITRTEAHLMRWVQNAVFSGGLRSVEDFPPRPTLKRGSRVSVYSSGELKSYLQEETEGMLTDLLTMKIAPQTLAGALVVGMKQAINRVPFDQGKLTQPAACAVAAALIRTNGMEAEAINFARMVLAAAHDQSLPTCRAPPQLRALWSASQLVRAWCDSLVVNGRARRHLEACGMESLLVSSAIESKEEEEGVDDAEQDEEELQYSALCQLVAGRCEFIVRSVNPPPFLRQPRRREDALARWHFLRERFCPHVSRFIERDPLGAVLRGVIAWAAIKRQPPSPPSAGRAHLQATGSSNSPPINYTPSSQGDATVAGRRGLKKLVSSDDVLQPHMRMGRPMETLTRRASLSSWGSTLRRKQSWFGVDTIDEFSPSNLSSPVSSVGGSGRPLYPRRGSIASTASGARVRSRAEGGLRRASVDGVLENIDVVDVARAEHEQSLSESVLSFVQTASPLRKRDLMMVLKGRNERAQARFAGLSLMVAVAQGTEFQSKSGRELFEALLEATMDALRLSGSEITSPDQTLMEAHYLTDLSGCSIVWRERVTAIFLALLRIVSHQVIRVAKNFRLKPQKKACVHLRNMLQCVALDYVESDYSLLFRSNILTGLQASLALPKECSVRTTAWNVFELLFRRCLIDNVDGLSIVGHKVQQLLMDVLMEAVLPQQTIKTTTPAPLSLSSLDEEEEDEDQADERGDRDSEGEPESPRVVSLEQQEDKTMNEIVFAKSIKLLHGGARFLSRLVRVVPNFTLRFELRVSSDSQHIPTGNLVTIGGDKTKRWSWMDVFLDEASHSLALRIVLTSPVGTGGERSLVLKSSMDVARKSAMSEGKKNPKRGIRSVLDDPFLITVSVGKGGRQVSLIVADPRSSTVTVDSFNTEPFEFVAMDNNNIISPAVPPSSVSPSQAPRTRRLNSRSSDSEGVLSVPPLLAGHLFVGNRPGFGHHACHDAVVSNVQLLVDKAMGIHDVVTALMARVDMTTVTMTQTEHSDPKSLIENISSMVPPRFTVSASQATTLRALDMAHSATRKGSAVALARLCTPFAQATLLQLVLDSNSPLQVRMASSKVLRTVVKETVANESMLDQLGRCVARAMPPVAIGGSKDLIADPKTASAMANEIADLIHVLCDRPGNWMLTVSSWIVQKMSFLDRIPAEDKLAAHEEEVREACAALTFCGGRLDSVRVGGKAIVVAEGLAMMSGNSSGARPPVRLSPSLSSFVKVIAQDYVGDVETQDVTLSCKLYPMGSTVIQRRGGSGVDDVSGGQHAMVTWEGASNSLLTIISPAPIQAVRLFIDDHRADCPRKLTVRTGGRVIAAEMSKTKKKHSLLPNKVSTLDVEPMEGWITLYSKGETNAFTRVYDVLSDRMPFSSSLSSSKAAAATSFTPPSMNPNNEDDDDFVVQIEVHGVWGYSTTCRLPQIQVHATVWKSSSSSLSSTSTGEDQSTGSEEQQHEERLVCVSTLEGDVEGDDEEDEDREVVVPTSASTAAAAASLAGVGNDPLPTSSIASGSGGVRGGHHRSLPASAATGVQHNNNSLDSGVASGSEGKKFIIHSASSLIPHSSRPPRYLLEGIAMTTNQDVFEAFRRFLSGLQRRIESSKGRERRIAMDLQVRVLKAVCEMIEALPSSSSSIPMGSPTAALPSGPKGGSSTRRVSQEMASFLLKLSRTHNAKLHPLPVATRFRRHGYPETWRMRFVSGANTMNDDTVKFEPLSPSSVASSLLVPAAAATPSLQWPHRFALVDMDLGTSGVHSWTFTLVQDAARGDETVLFGICTDKGFMYSFSSSSSKDSSSGSPTVTMGSLRGESSPRGSNTTQSSSSLNHPMNTANEFNRQSQQQPAEQSSPSTSSVPSLTLATEPADQEDLDLLVHHPKFRLLRAFDGSCVGAQPPSPMLCVRVGDSLRCELDLDKGTLSMAVNNRPLVCVFNDIVGPVWPCVATYAERGTVVVSLTNVKCTPAHPRRKCAVECKELSDEQVEALVQREFIALMAEGESDGSNASGGTFGNGLDSEERTLTFVGVPTVPDDDDEESVTRRRNAAAEGEDGDGDDADSGAEEEDELKQFDGASEAQKDPSMTGSTKSESSLLLLNKPPVLYRVEESVAAAANSNRPSSLIAGARNLQNLSSGSSISFGSIGKRPQRIIQSSLSPTDSSKPPMSPAARYEALLWELLARLSRRAFDMVVAHWQGTAPPPDESFIASGLGEAVASLYRVSACSHEASTELLKAVSAKAFMDLATHKLVSLGEEVSHVKKTLKRPRRKAAETLST